MPRSRRKPRRTRTTILDPNADLTGGDDSKAAAIDPERDETLNILSDLVQLTRRPEDRQHRALIR